MKVHPKPLVGALLGLSISAVAANGKWDLFLCFGQSNMAGAPAAEAQDKTTNPRIKALANDNCTGKSFDQWYLATPSLHGCGTGLGPGDYFSKTLLDTSDKLGLGIDTIGLIPCAIAGVDISFFSKGVRSSRRKDFRITPVDTGISAYLWMLDRVKVAMRKGDLRGIIFHQGESDWTDTARQLWPGRVAAIVKDLKTDLGLTTDIPFVAGELMQTGSACCAAGNATVAKIPATVPNSAVASSAGLQGIGDAYHFNAAAQRTFGHRYAAAMVPLLKKTSALAPIAGSTVPGLRIEKTSGWIVVRADSPLDRAILVSPQGRSVELEVGSEVRIPSDRYSTGVYFLHAVSGTALETRTLLID